MRFFEVVPPERFDDIMTGEGAVPPYEQAYGQVIDDQSNGQATEEFLAMRLYESAVRMAFEVGKGGVASRFLSELRLYTDGAHRYAYRIVTLDPAVIERELA